MPSQHKHPPISFRPGTKRGDPDDDRAWLLAYARKTGHAVNAIIAQAVAEFRSRTGCDQHDQGEKQ